MPSSSRLEISSRHMDAQSTSVAKIQIRSSRLLWLKCMHPFLNALVEVCYRCTDVIWLGEFGARGTFYTSKHEGQNESHISHLHSHAENIWKLLQLRTIKYSECSAVGAVTSPPVRAAAHIQLGHSTRDTLTLYRCNLKPSPWGQRLHLPDQHPTVSQGNPQPQHTLAALLT